MQDVGAFQNAGSNRELYAEGYCHFMCSMGVRE